LECACAFWRWMAMNWAQVAAIVRTLRPLATPPRCRCV
jgi:hypothetical protein